MRHRKSKTTLGRESQSRKALFRSLIISLITHGKIITTLAKAKAVRPRIEKLITKANKISGQASIRYFQTQTSNKATKKLLTEIAKKYKDRKGGYTRIIKLSARKGDAAEQAIIEFV